MTPEQLIAKLRTLDRSCAAETMPPAAFRRVEAAIRHRSNSRRNRGRWRLMATAAMVVLTLGAGGWYMTSTRPRPAEHLVLTIEGQSCTADRQGDELVLESNCSLRGSGLVVESAGPGALTVEDRRIEIHRGEFLFEVEKRRPDDPLKIKVSHGAVIVTGTRFLLRQRQSGGDLELYGGSVTFRHLNGREDNVSIGERFAWGQRTARVSGGGQSSSPLETPPVESAPAIREEGGHAEPGVLGSLATSPPKSSARPSLEPIRPGPAAFAQVSGEVRRLRGQGKFEKAVERLQESLAQPWATRHARALSYELGSLLELQVRDRPRACRHWEQHLVRFQGWPNPDAIRDSRRQLGCKSHPTPSPRDAIPP